MLFLRCVREVTACRRASLGVRVRRLDESGNAIDSWRALASVPKGGASLPNAGLLGLALAEGIARDESTLAFSVGGSEVGEGVVVLELKEAADPISLEDLVALLGVIPDAWQAKRSAQRVQELVDGLGDALDLSLVVGSQTRFTAAALAVCNELAARLACDRASLAWQDDTVLKMRAISQADKFDRRSAIVRQAEAAMEEAFDQEEILSLPGGDSDAIVREHEAYAKEAAVEHLCSVPLRGRGKVVGVAMLERAGKAFSEREREVLQVMADQVSTRLTDLRERDRSWPVRVWRRLKTGAAGFLGPKHTGPKLAGLAGALLVLFLVFGRLPYSVEAPATVKSSAVVFVTAPFDGFIEEAFFEVGDSVQEGELLVAFDTRELLVQQAAELANLNRYKKEVERARASNALADMRVAEAQAEQAEAVLDRTVFQLSQAKLKAPLSGVVVEGDLKRSIGSPVRQGDVLLQQASLVDLYIEINVPEQDVHEVMDLETARMLFASKPDEAFELQIERFQPSGIETEIGVVFRIRAKSVEDYPDWWRPGMTGSAKLDVGWRNAGWIVTHRTVDWLRRQLWW